MQDVFKNVRDDLTADGLLQNVSEYVYTKEELFHQTFLREWMEWNPHEIFSSILGLCFSIRFNQDVTQTSNFSVIPLW